MIRRHLNHAKRMRAHVRCAALTRGPLWLSRGKLAKRYRCQSLVTSNFSIEIPTLPPSLEGLRIVHLSDFHIGHLIERFYLGEWIKFITALEGDLIAITGDFVDLSLSVLDDVLAAIGQLQAPLGVHLVPGNHDYLADGPALIRRFEKAGLPLLINRSVMLKHHDCRIAVAGIDWARQPDRLAKHVQTALRTIQKRSLIDFTLLLAHHPNAFDAASPRGVDLTLAGHTHGGQVVLNHPTQKNRQMRLGSLGNRYTHGLYQQGPRYLHVTSGVGAWFPLRIKCPPEVAVLTLQRKA